MQDRVQRAHRRVADCLQVLASQPGDPAAPHARQQRPRLVGTAAVRVDRDLMTPRRQLARELPGQSLEAPVCRRDPAAAEDGELDRRLAISRLAIDLDVALGRLDPGETLGSCPPFPGEFATQTVVA